MKTKKISVLKEMGINDDGVYCIFPFSGLDIHNKGIFKIGITSNSFQQRLDNQYHTYFVGGFYYCAFLRKPIKNGIPNNDLAKHYKEIEKFIFTNIKNAKRISCNARLNQTSEWFYTNQKHINAIFLKAYSIYGGTLQLYDLNDQIFEKEESGKELTTMCIKFNK